MGKKYTQVNRPLAVTVEGLEPDTLLLVGFTGEEAISTLYHYRLDVLVENPAQVPFEKILGKSITVELELPMPGNRRARELKRTFNGICRRVTQGESDERFTHFRLDVAPTAWRLTKVARSRVFEHIAVLDILRELFKGTKPDISGDPDEMAYKRLGPGESPFDKPRPDLAPSPRRRDYCVQYRETDFNFASRLMAEEGFAYYFRQGDFEGAAFHQMVVSKDGAHDSIMMWPGEDGVYSNMVRYRRAGGDSHLWYIRSWEKVQELRAGKVTLRDHTFEKPQANLEASRPVQPDVPVGKVNHKLNGVNGNLELYDYPGQYAKRFDGIDGGGAGQPEEIAKIYEDRERVARTRMEQETTAAVAIHGESNCRLFTAGYRFRVDAAKGSLEAQAQAEGEYILASVQHEFGLPGGYSSGDNKGFYYRNTFTCVPTALPYRPPRTVPKPIIAGTQTAVVVGPKDGEVYTDKYGRVKVQFFWDREGKKDLDSSCWIRVAQFWAGQRWGAHFWPRVGQEVIVAFEEGDPDQPIIVGSVYNAENMPPYDMPKNQTRSGIKTQSTPQNKDSNEHFNEIRFEDRKGAEELHVQAERNLTVLVKDSEYRNIGCERITHVAGSCYTDIGKGMKDSSEDAMVTEIENGGYYLGVKNGKCYLGAKESVHIQSKDLAYMHATNEVQLRSRTDDVTLVAEQKNVVLQAAEGISLECGGGKIVIDSGGNIFISGTSVSINSSSGPATISPNDACSGQSGMKDFMNAILQGKCGRNGQPGSAVNRQPSAAHSP